MLHATDQIAFPGIRKVAAFATLLLLLTGARSVQAADPEMETVSVYLNVERDGSLVTGLGEANFRFREDGRTRQFRLERPEEPASIAVLLEYSRSSGYYLDDLTAAVEGFHRYAPEGNWYALATFSRGLDITLDFTRQPGRIADAFARTGWPFSNEINTYDAVYGMLDRMSRLPGRKILIVVGSGLDTFSEHSLDDVKEKIESSNVTIFAAGTGSMLRTSQEPYLDAASRLTLFQAQAFLQMLAGKSGGFAWFPMHSQGFPDVMQGVMQSIAAQYRLVYDTTALGSGKFHKIKVEAFRVVNDKREDFKVLVREGWR